MYTNETFRSMSVLIVLQHFVCIRRSFLLPNTGLIVLSNVMLVAALSGAGAAVALDAVRGAGAPPGRGLLAFQVFMSLEALHLIINGAFKRKTFDAIKQLDEKCLYPENYSAVITKKCFSVVMVGAVSMVADVFWMWRLQAPLHTVAVLTLAFAVHDSEIGFYAVLMAGVGARLRGAAAAGAAGGARGACTVYRHALLVAAHIKREFNLSILIMLGVTFVVTIVYCLAAYLADADKRVEVWSFLAWRQLRSLYSVWLLCTTATDTKVACGKVLHHVSNSLVFHLRPNSDTEVKKTTRRLFESVKSESPRYVYGSIFSVDLGVPLRILDISINYFLIILQIYIAYIMKK